jgi:predicted XRE-type DNA-binding protein
MMMQKTGSSKYTKREKKMKLTSKDVKVIRKLSREQVLRQDYIATCYDVTQAMVSYIKNNQRRAGVK